MNFAGKIIKKIAHYAVIAFSGYEVGSIIDNKDKKEVVTTIIKETENKTKDDNVQTIILILAAMIFISIVFVAFKEIIKCSRKVNNTTLESIQVQQLTPSTTSQSMSTEAIVPNPRRL